MKYEYLIAFGYDEDKKGNVLASLDQPIDSAEAISSYQHIMHYEINKVFREINKVFREIDRPPVITNIIKLNKASESRKFRRQMRGRNK